MRQPHSSRQRYRSFVRDYKARRLDETADEDKKPKPLDAEGRTEEEISTEESDRQRRGKRREYPAACCRA